MAATWTVYIVQTLRGSLYTGITTDTGRRVNEHTSGRRGAKSLRGKGPLKLVFEMPATDRSQALKVEAMIKKLSRSEKQRLIAGDRDLLERITG